MSRTWTEEEFGPMKHKTYDTALTDLISKEFGYIGGPDVISLFVEKVKELNKEYYCSEEFVKPGQMRWLGVSIEENYGRAKSMKDMELVPITLTIIDEEDIEDCCDRLDKKKKRQKLIARMYKEAKDQGAVLPEADAAALLRISRGAISHYITEYEEETGDTVPRTGTEMDMGRTLTHKKEAFHNYKKKIPTTENAKHIDHTPKSVDKYIKDGTRVEKLHGEGFEVEEIARLTDLSISLVEEYIEVIEDVNQSEE